MDCGTTWKHPGEPEHSPRADRTTVDSETMLAKKGASVQAYSSAQQKALAESLTKPHVTDRIRGMCLFDAIDRGDTELIKVFMEYIWPIPNGFDRHGEWSYWLTLAYCRALQTGQHDLTKRLNHSHQELVRVRFELVIYQGTWRERLVWETECADKESAFTVKDLELHRTRVDA